MKKLLTLCSLLSVSFLSVADSISIRADEWFPMNGDPNAVDKGYMIDIAEAIAKQNGHSLDYKLMPWERALEEVRKGEMDCVVGAYKEDAEGFEFPAEHWGIDSTGVFVNASDSYTYNGMGSLKGRSVGVIAGYAYGEEIDEAIKSDKNTFKGLSGNNALEKNIKKLTSKRIDTLIESTAVFKAKSKELGLADKVKQAGIVGDDNPLYIACSPAKASSKAYIKMFDDGIETLRQSGELSKIMSKYGMTDWK